jgi:NAD(P)-dependent dehydrogenase (short-subunit alcohol dehydrogenase family)
VKEFSKKFHSLENKLDILMNNAGIFGVNRALTVDGFEMHMGVNHFGHFLLTNLLLDLLKAAAPSRIVIVSSDLHHTGNIYKDDLTFEKGYGKFKAYGNSKLANVLHGVALTKRLKGTNVTANSCHPGAVRTEIGRNMNPILSQLMMLVLYPIYKNVKEGAQTQIMLSVDPDLENVSGKYFNNCKEQASSKDAQDEELAEWLWNKSEELTS